MPWACWWGRHLSGCSPSTSPLGAGYNTPPSRLLSPKICKLKQRTGLSNNSASFSRFMSGARRKSSVIRIIGSEELGEKKYPGFFPPFHVALLWKITYFVGMVSSSSVLWIMLHDPMLLHHENGPPCSCVNVVQHRGPAITMKWSRTDCNQCS